MVQNQVQEVSASRLRDMVIAVNYEKRKKRAERIEVFNHLNDRFNEWVDGHKEIGFHISRDSNTNSGVSVEVVGFEDGHWLCGYSVQLSDRGCGSGINANDNLYNSRDEAVRAGVVAVMQYLLTESVRTDISESLNGQLRKFIKASIEIVLGQKVRQSTLF